MKKTPYIHPSLNMDEPPANLFINFDAFRENTETRLHSHEWGQLQIITGGSLEVYADNVRFIAPPNLAIWVPSGSLHRTFNRRPLNYCSINITSHKADAMPKSTCLMNITPIILAIIEDFRLRLINIPKTEPDKRLCDVLLDQLYLSKRQQHFLPSSDHKLIKTILDKLEEDPTDNTSLKEWATRIHTTERTLARHCQLELGMSFTEWRIRSRYLHSMTLLKSGMSVKEVALTLGYRQASPFIAMFKKYSNETPDQYKSRIK